MPPGAQFRSHRQPEADRGRKLNLGAGVSPCPNQELVLAPAIAITSRRERLMGWGPGHNAGRVADCLIASPNSLACGFDSNHNVIGNPIPLKLAASLKDLLWPTSWAVHT